MAKDEGRQAIGGIRRRSVLRGGLLAGAGAVTVGATSAVLTGTAQAGTLEPQPDWAYCIYCATMWWTPSGGGFHACSSSNSPYQEHTVAHGDYVYEFYSGLSGTNSSSNPQANWNYCEACTGMFWGPSVNNVCFSQGAHISSGTSYDNYWNGYAGTTSDPQPYWRRCGKCALLYWQGPSGNSGGSCPANNNGNGPHKAGSSTSYSCYWLGTY